MKAPRLLASAAFLLAPPRSRCLAGGADGPVLREMPAPSAPSAPANDDDDRPRPRKKLHDPDDRSRRGPADVWNEFLRSGRSPRRDRKPIRVDYEGQHPFEHSAPHDNPHDDARRTERWSVTAYNDESRYRPMRVQFDTHLLDALSEAYPSHVSYVRNVLLPSLRNFWAEALSTIPAAKIEVPLTGQNNQCADEVKELSGLDLDDYLRFDVAATPRFVSNIGKENNVELGDNGLSLVYHDRDLVVIVIPVEGTDLCPQRVEDFDSEADSQLQTLAFATNCQHDQVDRPTVGYTGICFAPMDPSDRTQKTHKRRVLTIAHEFTHILGMNSYDFPFFYDHATKRPRTPRNQWNMPPETQVLCVDGTRQSALTASEDTLKAVTTANGYIAYEVVTETVRNVVRNQFDCRTVEGGRLENQPTGEMDCFGSHWDHRLFNNEFMTAVYTGSTQYVTALTLALLEDSGWYIPNYGVAQNSPFGLGKGCEFLEGQCIQRGSVPEWGRGTFCSSGSSVGCTPDKHLIAYCDISEWDGNLPSGYQYFEDPSIGGGLQQMDFCPAYTTIFRFEVGVNIRTLDCTDPNLNGAWVQKKGESFGESSRCIEHASGARPLCLEVVCGKYGAETGKVVMVSGDGTRMRCSYDGEIHKLPSGNSVICPSFAETCPESICPANCAGRGMCDFTMSPAQCECFDRTDTSAFCADSPWSFAPTISPAPTQSAEPSASPTTSPRPTEEILLTSSGSTMGGPVCAQLRIIAVLLLLIAM